MGWADAECSQSRLMLVCVCQRVLQGHRGRCYLFIIVGGSFAVVLQGLSQKPGLSFPTSRRRCSLLAQTP